MKNLLPNILFIGGLFATLFWQCQTELNYKKGTAEHIKAITAKIDDAALVAQESAHGDWLTHGRNYKEDRYSKLDQINQTTVKDLGLVSAINVNTKRGIQGTPLVVDGIMFASGPWSVMWAFNMRTGEKIWEYDPISDRSKAFYYCCGVGNRGPAIYKGAILWGTLDGRLISVDAATGEKNWEINTIPADAKGKYSITGAPRIMDGKVLIGNGGAEFEARGFVTAYDAMTGKKVWRFYTVPGDPSKGFEHPDLAEAAKTWNGEWWNNGGGGGTVWDAITYDPELKTVFIGVGNGTHWNRDLRSPGGGDNLYLSSIVALNVSDGTYKWHYQTTPGDTWDFTATQPLTMTEMDIEGEQRKVIMQAPKNGFFYVLDRVTGELLSAKPFVYQNWTTGEIDENGRPIEKEGARYGDGRMHFIAPCAVGGHNWHPQSYSRKTGLVYLPTAHVSGPYSLMQDQTVNDPKAVGGNAVVNMSAPNRLYIPPVIDPNVPMIGSGLERGRLKAWDPINQKEVWGVDQAYMYNSGVLSTAGGLVFHADAEGKFMARNDETGELLWEFDVRGGVIAPPITYSVDGEQYVTIPVGWGGTMGQIGKKTDRIYPGHFYTFKIGGTAKAPEKPAVAPKKITLLATDAPPENIGNGATLFFSYCALCHNNVGGGGGNVPDLARSSDGIFNSYHDILLEGMLASQGMPNFSEWLTEEEVGDIKSYILYTATAIREDMDTNEMLVNLAKMQYLADTKGPVRKDIK